jgi:transcriptional regulator with XRE-family HTH domain
MSGNHMTARVFLAKELRRARDEKGMTQGALAKALYVSDSLVAAWETGRRVPKPEHVAFLIEILGIDPLLGRMITELVRNMPPEWLGKWLDIEAHASSISTYQPLLIPGLLQTPDYAREVILKSGRQHIDVDELVEARLERQKILTSEDPPMLVVVLDENVLRRPIGNSNVMREQLTHLLNVAQRPDVMLQIVRFEIGAYPGLAGGFVIAGFDGREAVYVENVFNGEIIDSVEDVATMKRLWEGLRVEALPAKQSIELVTEVIEQWK